MRTGHRRNKQVNRRPHRGLVTVSMLEPLYRAYEQLTVLQARCAGLRAQTADLWQDKHAMLGRLKAYREAMRAMIRSAHADLEALEAIYEELVRFHLRWPNWPPLQAAISSLRAALCRYR